MLKKWGRYKVLDKGKGWKVKFLSIKPKRKTSVQRHLLRDEILIDIETKEIKISPKNHWHCLLNMTDKEKRYIEIQIGKCKESDIIRRH